MVAVQKCINFQQFIESLPVDIGGLARIYIEFFAYAVPLFQHCVNEIHRFDNL